MTAPYYADDRVTVHHGSVEDVLPTLPDASVDAVVCDPPYNLPGGFMGREWDRFEHGSAFQAWCEVWAAECLRILKPGGYLLAFGGTRTWHRMVCAIEDAGFDIRDGIADLTGQDAPGLIWTYGSGFPKSLDVGKAIDKAGGSSPQEQAAVLRAARERAELSREQVAEAVGCTVSSVRDWEDGRARSVGRGVEHIVPSAEYRAHLADLLGYTRDERLVVGVGKGSRSLYETGHRGIQYGGASTPLAHRWSGWGTALKPAWEPIAVARKPLSGTVAGNVLTYGTGALNIDGCRTRALDEAAYRANAAGDRGHSDNRTRDSGFSMGAGSAHDAGRWPSNVVLTHSADCDEACAADCPVVELDRQSGHLKSGANPTRRNSNIFGDVYGDFAGQKQCTPARGADEGGASRFFPVFHYEAKAPASERPKVDGITHPTVKPLDLLRWLVRLVTPPGGLVLDPFLGSGTTAEACVIEGFRCIGIEREAEYLPLIKARLDKPMQAVLGFDLEAS